MEESLGRRLQAARSAAGISVDDAVYLAKIPRAVVVALEAEDFGFFTSPLYARSFLKQYSEYIGANVDPWLDDLEPTTMIDGENFDSYIDMAEPVAAVVTRQKSKGKNGGNAWAALWMLVITAGVFWVGMKIYSNFESALAESTAPEQPYSSEPEIPADGQPSQPEKKREDPPQSESEPISESSQPAPRAIPVLPGEN